MNGAEKFSHNWFQMLHTQDDSGDPRMSDPAEAQFHAEWVAKVEAEMDEDRYWAEREEADQLYKDMIGFGTRWA